MAQIAELDKIHSQLDRLKLLNQSGLIGSAEYEETRSQLLDQFIQSNHTPTPQLQQPQPPAFFPPTSVRTLPLPPKNHQPPHHIAVGPPPFAPPPNTQLLHPTQQHPPLATTPTSAGSNNSVGGIAPPPGGDFGILPPPSCHHAPPILPHPSSCPTPPPATSGPPPPPVMGVVGCMAGAIGTAALNNNNNKATVHKPTCLAEVPKLAVDSKNLLSMKVVIPGEMQLYQDEHHGDETKTLHVSSVRPESDSAAEIQNRMGSLQRLDGCAPRRTLMFPTVTTPNKDHGAGVPDSTLKDIFSKFGFVCRVFQHLGSQTLIGFSTVEEAERAYQAVTAGMIVASQQIHPSKVHILGCKNKLTGIKRPAPGPPPPMMNMMGQQQQPQYKQLKTAHHHESGHHHQGPQHPPGPTIGLFGLPWDMPAHDIEAVFKEMPGYSQMRLINLADGRFKGYGFFDFVNEPAATQAKQALEQLNLNGYWGRDVNVRYCDPKK
eukprot:TRINITY_DN48271_c0_g1_i1.p1 TRINITY_DN48271_c0_g1~~TRINITY_DN48271_c0_g1_i1.p1  ORF type:complete len:489 (-),score=67.14 TRINITY_DN48271_c0_g1_i1:51-1517(-)